MKKVFTAFLSYLMLHMGAFGYMPETEEPVSHIYFYRYVYEALSPEPFITYSSKELDAELIADVGCMTEFPEVTCVNETVYIIRDDAFYEYNVLTGEKTRLNVLDTSKHYLQPMSIQIERKESHADSFNSHRYFIIIEKESKKEAVYNIKTKQLLTDFQYSNIAGVTTDIANDAEFIFGNCQKPFETEIGTMYENAVTIFKTEMFEVFYDGMAIHNPRCEITDGKILFYDSLGSTEVVSSDGKILQSDEPYRHCCFLSDGNFVLSGGKSFYVYDKDFNLVHKSKQYDKTNEIVGVDNYSDYHYSEYNYITVVKDGILKLTDVYETFSVPVCRMEDNMSVIGSKSSVEDEPFAPLSKKTVVYYAVQTGVDGDGVPLFSSKKIPQTLPAGIYLFISNKNIPDDVVGNGLIYVYIPSDGTLVKIMNGGYPVMSREYYVR